MTDAPFDAFRYAHEHRQQTVWMCQNTNHLVPPSVVSDAIIEAIRERRYEGYPYAPGWPELRERVLADLGFAPDYGLCVTAGGTEALYMLTRALLGAGDEVVASDPSYLIIHKFIELCGARTRNLEIYQPPYRLTSERVQEAVGPKTRMILLIDPLNPLGSGYPKEEVRAIAEIAHDHHLPLVNDVTYRDFADAPTLAAPFAPDETLTVWSVSKNCGLAGMRLGGLAGPKELVAKVARFNTNDLGVNVLAQAAAVAALRTKSEWFPQVRATTRANQETIREAVGKVPGAFLPVFPSQANMFVIDLAKTEVSPEALQKELLLGHGVFVRAGNYLSPQFGSRFVRVSFSNPTSDIAKFVAAFPLAVKKLRAPSALA
ncbi:MAG: pyridoxal phosphate-dependent aminotransferase [Thermoplasmata archaeon]|nr:pyridoxal phosphate-dependent aminotransferase [Thermoplasmata archaeon]MCI4321322.1 pyridoxal phosphate-dependent aminotransferase [Thermoplasmata archaeon]